MNLTRCTCGGTPVRQDLDNRDFWVVCCSCRRESKRETGPTKAGNAWNQLIEELAAGRSTAPPDTTGPTSSIEALNVAHMVGEDANGFDRTIDLDGPERILFEVANKHRPLMREDYLRPDPEVHHRYYDVETQAAWEGWQACARTRLKPHGSTNPQVDAAELAAALADPDQVPYLIVFEDADRQPEYVRGKKRARLRYKHISASWNAHLFVKIDSNHSDALLPSDSELRLQAGIDEDIARYAFERGLGAEQDAQDAANPQKEIAALRIECARLSRGWSDAATLAAHLQSDGSRQSIKNEARMAHLEQWRLKSQQRGCKWNTYSFYMGTPVADQIDADIAKLAAGVPKQSPASRGSGG